MAREGAIERADRAPERNVWLHRQAPSSRARARLFCFSHAGGGSVMFRAWRERLSPEVDVCAVVLPGRERRRHEAPLRRMHEAVEPICEAIASAADLPFAFFGHSMGAALAYETAKRCRGGSVEPQWLFVSGRRAPHLPARRQPFYTLPDAEFLRVITALNGTPAEVLRDPDLLRVFMPCLRADFELIETYQAQPAVSLACPVSSFAGDADPEVNAVELAAWSRVTSGEFRSRMFKGDHFYLLGAHLELLARVKEDLLYSVDTSQ
jgi:surfactin synthase thioesterase subunit